jgi:protein O-mannosyl-transferase
VGDHVKKTLTLIQSNLQNSRIQLKTQITTILLIGVIAYSNSFNVPFNFDDVNIIKTIRQFNSGNIQYTRFFADLSFVFNSTLNGQDVAGYHIFNLLVHLTAAIVLLFLVRSVLTALSISFASTTRQQTNDSQFMEVFIPCATALLFVSHPVQTQAVTYIVQRYASLAALFYMASVLGYIHARVSTIQSHNLTKIWGAVIFSIFTGFIAFFCKETAYTLPAMFMLIEVFLFKGEGFRNKYIVLLISSLLFTMVAVQASRFGADFKEVFSYSIQRATKEELTYARSDYLMTQFGVVSTYIRLLLLPINQNLDYDIPLERSLFTLPVLSSLVLHVSLILISLVLFFKSRKDLSGSDLNRGICLRLISFGIFWFYLTLLIESSIIPILDVIFEHRLYLPSAGAVISFVATATIIAGSKPFWHKRAWICLALVCSILTIATIKRNFVWCNDLRLWEDTADKSPNKPRVLSNLAAAYLRAGYPEMAVPHIIRSLELAPANESLLNNIEGLLDQLKIFQGRYESNAGFMTDSNNINYKYLSKYAANSNNNLGLVYEYAGNYDKARQSFIRATAIDPSCELAWLNVLLNSIQLQDRELALASYNKLKALNPQRAMSAEKFITDHSGNRIIEMNERSGNE